MITMPFVMEDMLVFASNEAGGLEEYDLYYSNETGSGCPSLWIWNQISIPP